MIDVAGGDKVPRKGGPGITGSDLLVVNKVSFLACLVGRCKRISHKSDRLILQRQLGQILVLWRGTQVE